MNPDDTIAAISSPVGAAARMIVRISGPKALAISKELGACIDAPESTVSFQRLRFSNLIVPCQVYLFSSPKSYTGDDLVELHLPGSPVLVKILLAELLSRGVRSAEPGEFTARAYFNGKMDLTRAEGVAATIAANSEQQLAAARQLLSGELARRLEPIMDSLADTLALLEMGIDFSQEDISFISWSDVRARVEQADAELADLLSQSARFERMAHEPQVVLVGRPNAGKSTLLNALAGHERAVVSPIAGTTRDVLWVEVTLARGKVRVMDGAGMGNVVADDEIELKMQAHALRAVESADVVVLIEEAGDDRPSLALAVPPSLVVRTKLDLFAAKTDDAITSIEVSALTGAGLDRLKDRLDQLCFGPTATAFALALNLRHVKAIEEARRALSLVLGELASGSIELIALELRESLDCLGEILGRVSADDLLGRIFAGFCIGK